MDRTGWSKSNALHLHSKVLDSILDPDTSILTGFRVFPQFLQG
jgi:hypothetical protein